jgi:hypothetical protein
MQPDGDANANDDLQDLAHTAVEHLSIIRKYLAWIAFVVVLTFALSVAGVILVVADQGSGGSTADFCSEFPGLC